MVRLLITAWLLVATCRAQVSAVAINDPRETSNTAITIKHEHDGISAPSFRVDVTATGSWTLTPTGTCPSWGYGVYDAAGATLSPISGTGSGYLYVWKHHPSDTTTPGTTSCTIILTEGGFSATLTITEITTQRWRTFYSNWRRLPDAALGCSKAVASEEAYSVCPLTDLYPGTRVPQAVGSTRIDAHFGAPVWRMTLASNQTYANLMGGSGTYVTFTTGNIPTNGIYTAADGVLRNAQNGNNHRWSPFDPNVYFLNAGGNTTVGQENQAGADWIRKYTCNTNCTSPTLTSTYSHGSPIDTGGATQISREGYIGFWVRDEVNVRITQVCYYNTRTDVGRCGTTSGITGGQPGWGIQDPSPDYLTDGLKGVLNPVCDDKRCYLVGRFPTPKPFGSLPTTRVHVWTFTPGQNPVLLTPDGVAQPDTGSSASSFPDAKLYGGNHVAVLYADGKAYYVVGSPIKQKYASGYGIAMLDLTNLADGGCAVFAQAHGGCWVTGVGSLTAAEYPSGSHSQVIFVSHFPIAAPTYQPMAFGAYSHDGTTATITTTAKSGGNMVTANHGLVAGDSIVIQGVRGVTGANGTFTAAAGTTGSTLVVTGTFSGTWTTDGANSPLNGTVQKNVNQAWHSSNAYGVDAARVWRYGIINTRRLAKVYSEGGYSTCVTSSYEDGFTRGQIVYDGTHAYYTDNHGVPCQGGAHRVDTGFRLRAWTPPNHFNLSGDGVEINRTATTAVAKLKFREGRGACTLRYNSDLDVTRGTSVSMTAGGAYQTAAITGLTAGTRYYWRVECDNWDAAAGEFQTLASGGDANSTVAVEMLTPAGATQMAIDWGTNPASLTNSTTVACTPGQICRQVLSAARADNMHYSVRMLSASGALIQATREVVALP